MKTEIITSIEQTDWYKALIEDCEGIITEAVFTSRFALVAGYHALGHRILQEHDNFQRAKIYGENICSRVSNSLNKSRQTVQRAIQCAKKYPKLDDIPEGKNISWHKLCNKYLPSPKEKLIELPKGKYSIIYADPGWEYADEASAGERGATYKYTVKSSKELKQLQVRNISANDCVLFMWVTMPKLNECFGLIEEWGFEYKTCAFTWVKRNKSGKGWFWGMGRWTRANAELCLLATKGNPQRISASVHSVIETPIEGHSKKPDIVRKRIIELCGELPRVELFAREKVKGWESWGNQI